MKNKLILWGLIIFLASGAGWFLFVILSVVTLGKLAYVANFFGKASLLGLAVMVVGFFCKLLNKTKIR